MTDANDLKAAYAKQVAGVGLMLLLAAASSFAAMPVSGAEMEIRVDAAAPRVPVSPRLYGIFFEEINHAGEGGLYAEMVLNRDFEITNLPAGARWAGNLLRTTGGWQERKWFGNETHGWSFLADEQTRGSLRLDLSEPLNDRNPHSLRLSVRTMGGMAGVANGGFWGMNFQAGEWYELSFYARTGDETRFDLTVSLESRGGEASCAKAVIPDVGGPWKRYTCSLRPTVSDPQGRLTLRMDHPGTLWLDVLSLFPRATYKNRPNGLRPDLVQMLADLKPAFVRFPGGAILGGLNLDNRIQWKNSIGDIAQRRGTMNLWGYYTTNGLGFHEYLQLCEDLDAEALWVCNPGFSDNYRKAEICPPEQVPAFVREALDALEYALGPADSPWGSRRAANGHPEPFALHYLEIGNEASGAVYEQNYRQFYEAIHARYPGLTIISNQDFGRRLPVAMVDHHRYGSPDSFFAAADRYDRYDRRGPAVYVGEYGCNSGVGSGNLRAALSEAAFLIGLERNADIVKMASYAPLFFNVNDIAWPVNMIGFDSSRVVGRSSYYVQKLFSQHRPDEVLSTRVTPEVDAKERPLYALAGMKRAAGEIVLKAVNRTGRVQRATIRIEGFDSISSTAQVTTLAHEDPEAENTLYDPEVVVPRESQFQGIAPVFDYPFPPYSLTILRIKT